MPAAAVVAEGVGPLTTEDVVRTMGFAGGGGLGSNSINPWSIMKFSRRGSRASARVIAAGGEMTGGGEAGEVGERPRAVEGGDRMREEVEEEGTEGSDWGRMIDPSTVKSQERE